MKEGRADVGRQRKSIIQGVGRRPLAALSEIKSSSDMLVRTPKIGLMREGREAKVQLLSVDVMRGVQNRRANLQIQGDPSARGLAFG